MSLRTLIEGFIASVATDVVKLTKFTTGSNTGTDLSALSNTLDRTSLPAAINGVLAIAVAAQGAAGAVIDDGADSLTKTNSSSKVTAKVQQAVADLVASSPAALDTLKELADALGDDPQFATNVATALGKRIRVDAAQSFTGAEKTQALSNIGAIAASDVGDTTTSLVAVYTAAKSA